jgi:hypothetical protein
MAELAKRESNKLAQQAFQGVLKDVPRPDAVQYCLAAIQMFSKMSKEEVKRLALEISIAGQAGLDLNRSDAKYQVKGLQGLLTGLQLVSYLYVAMQQIAPGESMGFDLSKEYGQARTLFAEET